MGNLQPHHTAPQAGMSSAPEPGPQTPKRPRLTAAMERPDLTQPLRIDISQAEPKRVSIQKLHFFQQNSIYILLISQSKT